MNDIRFNEILVFGAFVLMVGGTLGAMALHFSEAHINWMETVSGGLLLVFTTMVQAKPQTQQTNLIQGSTVNAPVSSDGPTKENS